MEKPLFTFGVKEFLSGINSSGAHTNLGGVFYKADGVTPLFDAGSAQSVNNGLLMAGAGGTLVGGTLGGNVLNIIPDGGLFYTGGGLVAACTDNKIYKIGFESGAPTGALGSVFTAAATLTPGLISFLGKLYYRQTSHIGQLTPPSTNDDTWQAASTDYFGAMHQYFDTILFGNGLGKLGMIDSALAVTLTALDFDTKYNISAISDDGIYAVIALTKNTSADSTVLDGSVILFWDGAASSWLRSYPISDPLIYSIKKTPVGVFGFGITGIWQITFDGVKKVFSHSPGIYTASGASVVHYGQAASFFSDALIWGGQSGSSTARVLKSLGKLDSESPPAYLNPILGTASQNITAVNGQLLKGLVFVADDTPQMKYYPIGSGTPQTTISAQTVYFDAGMKANIKRIVVIFGEPLISGDSMSIQLKTDEDATATTAITATYADDGAIRRKSMRVTGFTADEQFSMIINFTAGAVKIKRIEIYGNPVVTL